VDGFQTDLYRLRNGFTRDYTRCHFFNGVGQLSVDRAFAVDRVAERVYHAAFQCRSNWHLKDALGATAGLTFGQFLVVTEYYCTHGITLEVQGHAVNAAFELDHFAVHHISEAMNTNDTVRHADDRAFVLGLRSDIKLLDSLLDDVTDFRWIQLLHAVIPQHCPDDPPSQGRSGLRRSWFLKVCSICRVRSRRLRGHRRGRSGRRSSFDPRWCSTSPRAANAS